MARDIKLTQDSTGCFDINFSDGDIVATNGLDSAFYMSVFYKERATIDEVKDPTLRQGHFTDTFNADPNYQVGCKLWLYTEQAKLTETNNILIAETVKQDGFQFMIDDNIVNDVNVEVTGTNTAITIDAEFESIDEVNSEYYQAYINTFS